MRQMIAGYFAIGALLLISSPAQATDCCEEHPWTGCDNWNIEACVCAGDAYCCDTEWDAYCVSEVEEFGCGSCSGYSGDCCASNGSPGCSDGTVTSCVCAQDAYCCDTTWDAMCASEVEEFGCGQCGGGTNFCPGYGGTSSCCTPDNTCGWDGDGLCDCDGTCSWDDSDCGGGSFCGDGVCDNDESCGTCADDCGSCGGGGDCCSDNGTPGCDDAGISACVCAQDAYCCETKWDDICAGEVDEFGCGQCGGGSDFCPGYGGTSSCCTLANGCGWNDDNICDCDGTCPWDSGDCGGGGSFCGDGGCDADESCGLCPQDCGSCAGDGDCCAANGTPGCLDAAIAACVCADDAFCCETEWDDVCVDEVSDLGCGQCGGGSDFCPGYTGSSSCCKTGNPCDWANDNICDCNGSCAWDGGDCGGGEPCGDGICAVDEDCATCPDDCGWCGGDGDCCADNGTPGCDNPAVESCVCADDAYCCETKWDGICAGEVESMGCGSCNGTGPECGDGSCDAGEDCQVCPEDCGPCGGTGSCCEPQDTPGCDNPTLQACVCAQDSFCCEFTWDGICVEEVAEFGCGSCDGGGCGDGQCTEDESCLSCPDDCGPCAGSGCCSPHPEPGCDDGLAQACVCEQDAFCCETEWDEICVNEVTSLGCGVCDGGPACGDGQCQGGENCEVCPQDCGECAGAGDCCAPQETPGCSNPDIQACVCALDDYCCSTQWDDICVEEVEGEACGSCAPCQPQCGGKACGGDGCGGSCGTCAANESCQNGKCVEGACQPQCAGKTCGPDGCGGSCGDCQPGKTCNNGKCVGGCVPDCNGKQCGADGCGGTCGSCPPGLFCNAGHCQQQCQPDCVGKKCGGDGCGGTCGSCPPGFFCTADGHCDAQCQPDCAGNQCGDDGCGGSCGTCPPQYNCNNGHCTQNCVANCNGKQCGDDGCGGSCGNCPGNQFCNLQGHCVADCTPDCAGKACGSDGCGGACGTCGFSQECSAGQCVEACIPSCLGKECGDNGCGGSCGICGQDYACSPAGVCLSCVADCQGRQCGDDGCGGSCGECGAKEECHPDNGICYGPGADITFEPFGDAFGGDGSGLYDDECGPGQQRLYGKCVIVDDVPSGDVDSSCTVTTTLPATSPVWLLLALLASLFALRFTRRGLRS
jgi:hypothetical protein